MKRHIATLAVLALVVGAIIFRQRLARAPQQEIQPQDAIYAMLDAARAGDVKGYLASYTGQMEQSLRQSAKETGDAGFAKYLRDTNASVKGVAVQAPQVNGADASVRVEYIYQDRNEAQTMLLQKTPAGWKIARVDGAERVKTLVPYGTPVE